MPAKLLYLVAGARPNFMKLAPMVRALAARADALAPHKVFPGNRPTNTLVLARLDPYTLIRFGASWQATDQIEIYGRVENLLDEDYYLNNFPNLGSGWGTPAPPRTYGITVNWRM